MLYHIQNRVQLEQEELAIWTSEQVSLPFLPLLWGTANNLFTTDLAFSCPAVYPAAVTGSKFPVSHIQQLLCSVVAAVASAIPPMQISLDRKTHPDSP